MWSERASPEQLTKLVAALRAALPGDSTRAQTKQERGFACLNRGAGLEVFSKPLATVTYADGRAAVCGPLGSVTLEGRGFDILQAMLDAWQDLSEAILAGFLSYDLAGELEDLGEAPRANFQFPGFHFGLYDSSAAHSGNPKAFTEQPLLAVANSHALASNPDRRSFETSVERIVRTIHAGDIFQTNLCRSIEAAIEPGTEWDLFQRLRAINPSRYEAFLQIGHGQSILSVSPETFLKVDGGIVESRPIKGTRPRGRDTTADASLSSELLDSEKDRAELAMIVDVVRNDLARVCGAGSVEVVRHAELMSLPTVHHLFSTVRGKLRGDASIVDLLRAAFPAASISGAPKIEAMRTAMREERQPRGPCMGAIGWISMEGNMELSVAIRTAFVTGGRVRYYAGCGITADSDPRAEFEESRHKAAAFVRALGKEQDPNW